MAKEKIRGHIGGVAMSNVALYLASHMLHSVDECFLEGLREAVRKDVEFMLKEIGVSDEKRVEEVSRLVYEKSCSGDGGVPSGFMIFQTLSRLPTLLMLLKRGEVDRARAYNRYLHVGFGIPLIVDELEKILAEK